MRQAQKSGRSRGRGGRKSGGSGGGGNNINRVYDSAGPEGKVRGTPQQIIDKYLSLARDAQTSGDRVTAENFLQHAEHYQRILITAMQAQEQVRRDNSPQNPGSEPGQSSNGGSEQETRGEATGSGGDRAAGQDIGGMAMIDAGAPDEDLLVETGEMAAPAPQRSNGENRRRRRKPPAETPAASENQSGPADEPATEAAAEG